MKRLTMPEFADRMQAINRAMKIFGHMTNNDITRAFTAYQDILAETERPVMLTTEQHGSRSPSFLDEYPRPKCPDCGSGLLIRRVPKNDDGIQSQYVCSNDKCDLVLDSPMTVEEIMRELKEQTQKKGEENDV